MISKILAIIYITIKQIVDWIELISQSNCIMAVSTIVLAFTVALFSLNNSLSQEDLQELQSSIESPTTATQGPGISINNSLGSNTTTTVTPDAASSAISPPIQDRVTIGSFGDDRITGSNETEIIIGLLGADTVRGGAGNDNIQGNEDDILHGGQGADYFDCGEGIDIIIDFNIDESDDNAGNCEEISNR